MFSFLSSSGFKRSADRNEKLRTKHTWSAKIFFRSGSRLGISPLMLASMNGNIEIVQFLLEMGADVNAQVGGTLWYII